MNIKAYFIEYDERLKWAAKELEKGGIEITECLEGADIAVLGMPVAYDVVIDKIKKISPSQLVLGGKFDNKVKDYFIEKNISFVDYLMREELAILNAVPTAEGALLIALREMKITMHGAKCLVVGFGRIGKYLAKILSSLGGEVTVSSRKAQDMAWTEAMGYNTADTSRIFDDAAKYDLIVNTVPDKVITEKVISNMREDTLLIDLASLPGGVDTEAAEKYGIKFIHALSLPGKVAPVTAGKIIGKTVLNILDERTDKENEFNRH